MFVYMFVGAAVSIAPGTSVLQIAWWTLGSHGRSGARTGAWAIHPKKSAAPVVLRDNSKCTKNNYIVGEVLICNVLDMGVYTSTLISIF